MQIKINRDHPQYLDISDAPATKGQDHSRSGPTGGAPGPRRLAAALKGAAPQIRLGGALGLASSLLWPAQAALVATLLADLLAGGPPRRGPSPPGSSPSPRCARR